MGAVYEEMRKYSVIYEEAVIHILDNRSLLNFLIYEENSFLFLLVYQHLRKPVSFLSAEVFYNLS
jgi:hypothetical protein